MPGLLNPRSSGIVKFTNCRLACNGKFEHEDLWVSSNTGTILSSQAAFFDDQILPDKVIDLKGRIVSSGLIDVQLNGAFGFNFSTILPEESTSYQKYVADVNKKLVQTGVTSYVPTLTSQRPGIYQQALPYLRPSTSRIGDQGAESLGAHVEGPFLNPGKNGIHDVNVLLEARAFADIEACYGEENLGGSDFDAAPIKMITLAPELGNMLDLIPELRKRGIICSIGHSEATYEEASKAVAAGATMITHLFNAMRPLHHRNPGVFGVLGITEEGPRPYFGIIPDGIHLHPTAIKIAYNAHPEGCILVTDAMHLVGLPDGVYPWMNGDAESRIVKTGPTLRLEGTDKIAGSCITLIDCVNNFLVWSGVSVPQALKAVTSTPAAMLGIERTKGALSPGADADLAIFSEVQTENGASQLLVDEVWKYGKCVYRREGVDIPEPTCPLSSGFE